MSNIHPLLVHFPIALLSTGIVFDLVASLSRRDELHKTGWWMMVSGTVGLCLAIASGLVAEAGVVLDGNAQIVLDSHKQFAFVLAVVLASAFLWRVSCRGAIPSRMAWLFWGLYATGVCMLWAVSWYGGILVYEHGVSVFSP